MKRYSFILIIGLIIIPFSCFIYLFLSHNVGILAPTKDFNVVLISIDTLRSDHLSCYGYHRKTTPTIDKIAEKGLIFKNVFAPSSWTAPSVVSLLTSVYPINHGVVSGINYKINQTLYIQEIFSDELTTLPEILKAHDFTTFGVTSNYHLSKKFGFARGFDYFDSPPCLSAKEVNEIIYSWKDEIKKSDKFFLWIHYFDPHYPYYPKLPWIDQYTQKTLTKKLRLSLYETWESVEQLIPVFKKHPVILSNFIALYDSEINYVDSSIGELIQKLELEKNTLIIITADHGEEFTEHDFIGHGENLYRETIRVPLIIKLPFSDRKIIIEKQVSLLDVMPTILEALNIKPPKQTLGKSLLEKAVLSSLLNNSFLSGRNTSNSNFSELDTEKTLKSIITPEWKYIYNYGNNTDELYNIKTDPLELYNLTDKEPEKRNQLRNQLFKWASNSKKYEAKKNSFKLSNKEAEELKALGYVR